MKHVFDTDEIAHLWAHQTQSDARNKQGNFYFEGPVIFSYESHFPIAAFVPGGGRYRGVKAIVINNDRWSVTTSKHQSLVRRAIPQEIPTFDIGDYVPWDVAYWGRYHKEILKQYHERITSWTETAGKCRSARIFADSMSNVERTIAEGRRYVEFFALKSKVGKLGVFEDLLESSQAEVRAKIREMDEREKAAAAERWRKLKKLALKGIECWRRWEEVPVEIRSATNGYLRSLTHGDLLRVHPTDGNIYTSRGVNFPIAHGALALKVIDKVRESGVEWVPNGKTIHLGHYQVDKIEPNGNVKAGCHYVEWEEIERIRGAVEEWMERRVEK